MTGLPLLAGGRCYQLLNQSLTDNSVSKKFSAYCIEWTQPGMCRISRQAAPSKGSAEIAEYGPDIVAERTGGGVHDEADHRDD
jgi:hypothetical protein